LGIDPALTADRLAVGVDLLDDVVAVAVAAAGFAGLDPTAQTTPGLVGEVLEVERSHGALEPDVQLVHLVFGQGDDPDAQEGHALVDTRDVLLVAGHAIQASATMMLNLPAAASCRSFCIPGRIRLAPEIAWSM
jgi:hypothetical protein